ncbi:phytase [uncultured Sphingomonas sp.]|uniref:phytase n=1 Tax=uncultured Sphingomonas sp. TaxID=158754 RepID=UPI0035CC4A35
MRPILSTIAIFMLAGCMAPPPASVATAPAGTASVPAWRETDAVTSADDAADDPAIWRNKKDPVRSLIVATDKKQGLNVYGLDGKLRSTLPAGRVNNVDLRDGVRIAGRRGVLVAASDRSTLGDGRLALFSLDTATATLTALARLPITEMREPYGFCLYRAGEQVYAFVVGKDGAILQVKVDTEQAQPAATIVRRMKLQTQSEGCVADDRTGLLYVAEEDVGIWRFDASPTGSTEPVKLAGDDGARLVADAEGLAIAAEGRRGGYLVASSQGDSAYAIWRLSDDNYVGRFRIVPAGEVDGTSDTDGIEIATAGFGPGLEAGLMVAQDGDNAPHAQNFKLVRWADVKKALGIR